MISTLHSILKWVSLLILVMVSLFVMCSLYYLLLYFFLSFWFCSILGLILEKTFFRDVEFTLLHFFSLYWPQHVPVRIMTRSRISMSWFCQIIESKGLVVLP